MDVVRSSLKIPEFDKHLKKAGGHIGRNIVEIIIKMKAIVRKPLMLKRFNFELHPLISFKVDSVDEDQSLNRWQYYKNIPKIYFLISYSHDNSTLKPRIESETFQIFIQTNVIEIEQILTTINNSMPIRKIVLRQTSEKGKTCLSWKSVFKFLAFTLIRLIDWLIDFNGI